MKITDKYTATFIRTASKIIREQKRIKTCRNVLCYDREKQRFLFTDGQILGIHPIDFYLETKTTDRRYYYYEIEKTTPDIAYIEEENEKLELNRGYFYPTSRITDETRDYSFEHELKRTDRSLTCLVMRLILRIGSVPDLFYLKALPPTWYSISYATREKSIEFFSELHNSYFYMQTIPLKEIQQ